MPRSNRRPRVVVAAVAVSLGLAIPVSVLASQPASESIAAQARAAHEVGAYAKQSLRVGPDLSMRAGRLQSEAHVALTPLLRRQDSSALSCEAVPPTTTTSTSSTTTSSTTTTTTTTAAPTTTTTTTTTTLPTSSTSSTSTSSTTTTTAATTTTTAAPTTTTTTVASSSTSSTSSTTTTTTLPSATTTSAAPSTTTSQPSSSTTTPASVPTPASAAGAYYLIESNGGVHPYGGAGFFGSKASKRLPSPVVTGGVTADGDGYWLATASGSVYRYGDAHFYGSPVHIRSLKPVVAFAATPDGQGYWLLSQAGAVYNYGDAQFCGSAVHSPVKSTASAFAAAPDSSGYWIVTSGGSVYNYGSAAFYGSAVHVPHHSPIVGIAATADGGGYWLVASNGSVYPFGDAKFSGSPVHKHLKNTIIGISATSDSAGYWITSSTGRIFNYGDAIFSGSLARAQPRPPLVVVALIRTALAALNATPTTSPFAHGDFGYDISNYQCAPGNSSVIEKNAPPTSNVSIVEVAGWLDSADNNCLGSQAAWATKAAGTTGGPFSLYIFMNSPGTNAAAAAQDASGPAGVCASVGGNAALECRAYNYGYNGTKDALTYAGSRGVSAKVWWLDVEGTKLTTTEFSDFPTSPWSDSTTLNDETIQGSLDAFHQGGIIAGIYSTSVQFPTIAGDFVPSGPTIPLWIAGVPWTNPPFTEKGLNSTATLSNWCAGTATYAGFSKVSEVFADGVPWLLQETPGASVASPYGLDPDYAC